IPDRVRGARRSAGELREPVDLPLECAGLRRRRLCGGDDRLSRLARLRPGVHRLHQPRLGRQAPRRSAEGTRGRAREVSVARRGARLRARRLLRRLHDELDRGPLAGSLPLRSEEHTSELQSPCNLVCRLLLEKKKKDVLTVTYKYQKHADNHVAADGVAIVYLYKKSSRCPT